MMQITTLAGAVGTAIALATILGDATPATILSIAKWNLAGTTFGLVLSYAAK